VQLNGENKNHWEKIGATKSINFTNLSPGNYTLTVKNLADFNSNYKYKTITLIVPPAFYQTLWFKALCYILSIIVIIFLWQLRFYYMKRKKKRLEKIVTRRTQKLATTIQKLKTSTNSLKREISQEKRLVKTISHDIKSPLKYLNLTIQNLYNQIENQNDEKLKEEAKSLYVSSFQLYSYVENLVKYSSIFSEGKKLEEKNYLLYELVQNEVRLFEKMAMSENTIIINNIDKSEYSKTNNKILSIIVHNLLDNAVKNTKNGAIEFFSEKKDNKLFLSIKDTGTGMNKEIVDYYMNLFYQQQVNKLSLRNYGIGLHMVIELLLLLEGGLQIESKINSGTTIMITVDYI
jgi:K+-sensing histidine kinase KdpD